MSFPQLNDDVSATFASTDWFGKKPFEREPYYQLAGVLPRARQNSRYLDTTNTYLISSNVDMRPAYLQIKGVYATNCPRGPMPPPRC